MAQSRALVAGRFAALGASPRFRWAVLRRAPLDFLVFAGLALAAAGREHLALAPTSLELPGAPAVVEAVDLDGDGRRDLVVVVAYTRWEEIGIEEKAEMSGVDGLVEVLTVVPALFDRREAWAFLGREGGGYRPAGEPLELAGSVLSLEAGPPGLPIVALTDEGVAAVRLGPEGALALEPLIADPPVLAGAGTFLPGLELVQDLDGDGAPDLLHPAADGAAVYLTRDGALLRQAAARLPLPFDERLPGSARHYRGGPVRHYPLLEVRDADGDGLPDLLARNHQRGWNQFQLLRGAGGGRFDRPFSPLGDRHRDARPEVIFVGDLDGDGRAELVTQEELSEEDAGFRRSLAEAKRPPMRLAIHRLGPDLRWEPTPLRQFEVEGYAESGEGDVRLPGGFQDLNGDGRLDLVTLTLDFSLLQAVKVLAVRRISVGLDFHIWCQAGDGSFRRVPGLDLSGRFNLNLNNLRLSQLSLFAGDFDGDGRADFVQLGRGKTVTIHRGRDDCSYPAAPDLTLALSEPPQDLALVRVEDLDGDGRADLMVTQPQAGGGEGATAPVRLELYLSGGGSGGGR
jgi:hypothetical protein